MGERHSDGDKGEFKGTLEASGNGTDGYLQAFHGFYEFITFHQKSSIYKKLVSKLVSNNLNLRF